MNWKIFNLYCLKLAEEIKGHKFSSVFGIPKGGCYVAQELSHILSIPIVDKPGEGCIVVDDIVDSGRTIFRYQYYSTAAIFVKNHSVPKPTFYVESTSGWVDFPWEAERKETVEDNIVRILEVIGENPNRPGLKDTPVRIAKMYKEIFKGYDPGLKPDLAVFDNGMDGVVYDEMMFDTGKFVSWCEHHMLAFRGNFYAGYIPDKKIIGLSKISRIVDYYSSRLQIQERLVKQIADELESILKPKGLGVMLKASHLCKEVRGIKTEGLFITSDLRGVFREDQKVREEFLALVGINQ